MILQIILAAGILGFTTLGSVMVTTVDDINPLMVLANYGVLGVFTFLFVTKKIHTQSTVDVLNEQILALQKIIDAFQTTTTNTTLPALVRSNEILESLPQEGVPIKDLESLVSRLEELVGADGETKKGRR